MSEVDGWETTESGGDWDKEKNLRSSKESSYFSAPVGEDGPRMEDLLI